MNFTAIIKALEEKSEKLTDETFGKIKKQNDLGGFRFSTFVKHKELLPVLETKAKVLKKLSTAEMIEQGSKNIALSLGDDGNSYTDGKTITISLSEDSILKGGFLLYGEKALSEKELQTVTLLLSEALITHELQHVLSSDFAYIRKVVNKVGDIFEKEGIPSGYASKLAPHVLNIIEDGAIERIATLAIPKVSFSLLLLNLVSSNGIVESDQDPLVVWMNTLLQVSKLGTYPKGLDSFPEIKNLFDNSLREIVDKGVESPKNRGRYDATIEIFKSSIDFLKENLPELADMENPNVDYNGTRGQDSENDNGNEKKASPLRQPPTPSQESQSPKGQPSSADNPQEDGDQPPSDGDGENNSKGEPTDDENSDSGESSSEEETKGDNPSQNGSDDQGSSEKSKQNNSSKGQGSESNNDEGKNSPDNSGNKAKEDGEPSDEKSYSQEELESMLDEITKHKANECEAAIREAINRGKAQLQDKAPPKANLNKQGLNKINVRTLNLGHSGTESTPTEIVEIGRKLRQAMATVTKTNIKTRYGTDHGKLNMRTAGLASHGLMKKPFQNNRKVNETFALYLLGDNSGSMSTKVTKFATRSNLMLTAMAVIEEASRGMMIVKEALFSDCGRTPQHQVLKNWADKSPINRAYNTIQNHKPNGCNADDLSIAYACEELLQRPESKRILVVLSDGQPASYNGKGAKGVEEVVSLYRKKGITIISLMFGDPKEMDVFHRMYKKDYSYCTPTDLPKVLPRLISNAIKR